MAGVRKVRLILGLVIIAAVGVILLVVRGKRHIPTAPVQRGQFVIKIVRTGEVKARKSLTICAPSVGVQLLLVRLVPEGTYVKKGDFIAQFDTTELLQRLESARRELAAARADLELAVAKNELRKRELEDEVRKKEVKLKQAEGGSPVEIEDATRELEIAKARLETELKMMEAEIVKKKIDISRAEEMVRSAEKNLRQLTVTAPGDGIVIHEKVWRSGGQVKVQEGDSPWPGQPIISLPDLSTLYIATDIDEADISKVRLGQECRITLEAYPDTSFPGHITKIGNLARSKYYSGGPNVFDVSVDLEQIDERFKPGMIAKVEIIVASYDDRIFVPIESVFTKDGRTVVYVKRGTSFEERPIEIGERNNTSVIVTSGLEEGEEVALKDPTKPEG